MPDRSDVAPDATLAEDPWRDDPRLPGYFGEAWGQVARFHELLTSEGVLRGLVGPREVGRLWERHLLNSAAVVPFLPADGVIVDVGSGAGLPGVVVAAMRPEQRVVLLEPMERRVDWLESVVEAIALSNVTVIRGRAPETSIDADAVTVRAVAAIDKLYRWTMPLLRPGGVLVALKGTRAAEEVRLAEKVARGAGVERVEVLEARTLEGAEPTMIVRAVRR